MAGIITTGNFPKALWPGIKAWFGLQYDQHQEQWPHLFERHVSDKAFEEEVMGTGFGLAQIKEQGGPIAYDFESQGYISRYTHVVYALGFIVTWEEMINNLYAEVAKRRSERLAFSMRQTKEVVCANIYNRAFNSSYVGGDGVALCSTSHPTSSGLQSNRLSPDMDFSETALENLLIMVATAQSDRGHQIALTGTKLIVPPQLFFEAVRVVKSTHQSGTANNAVNAIAASGMLPEGIVVNNYLTDPDAFFVRTNCPHSMKLFQRHDIQFSQIVDMDTQNYKYVAFEYYSVGWSDWRGVYGSAGA